MYDTVNNEELCETMQKSFGDLDTYISSILPGGDYDERMDEGMHLLCNLEHAAFFAGANIVLDFIAGREVR